MSHKDIGTAALDTRSTRARLYSYMMRHGQALNVFANGLPSLRADQNTQRALSLSFSQRPSTQQIREFNPYASVISGRYFSPTYLVHGQKEVIPWQQAMKMYDALRYPGIETKIALSSDSAHLFDSVGALSRESEEILATVYHWLASRLRASSLSFTGGFTLLANY